MAAPKRPSLTQQLADTKRELETLREQLDRAADVANQFATERGLCSTYDEIVKEVVAETGLPWKQRNRQWHVTAVIDFTTPRDDDDDYGDDDEAAHASSRIESEFMDWINDHFDGEDISVYIRSISPSE
jgi:hypothetical protein